MSTRSARGAMFALVFVAAASAAVIASTKTGGTWAAPDLQPKLYSKILVLARVTEDSPRRTLEDAVVKAFQDEDIVAIPAYSNLVPADLESLETLKTRAKELGVDGGIVYTVTEFKEAEVVSPPKGSLSLGIGGWNGFVGGSVPIGGNTLETVHRVSLKGEFYSGGTATPVWMANYTTDLKNGVDGEARLIARDTIKYLKRAKMFAKPPKD